MCVRVQALIIVGAQCVVFLTVTSSIKVVASSKQQTCIAVCCILHVAEKLEPSGSRAMLEMSSHLKAPCCTLLKASWQVCLNAVALNAAALQGLAPNCCASS